MMLSKVNNSYLMYGVGLEINRTAEADYQSHILNNTGPGRLVKNWDATID